MKATRHLIFIIVFLFTHYEPVKCSWAELIGAALKMLAKVFVEVKKTVESDEFQDTSKKYMKWVVDVAKDQKKKYYVVLDEIAETMNAPEETYKVFRYDYGVSDPMYIRKFIGRGRLTENHLVRTKDGYLLVMHRLVAQDDTKRRNRSVILHHGLFGSSIDWFLRDSNESLPLLLADAGCEVWIANARGNIYSRRHVFMDVKSPEFWKFSFQEMGEIDLPAMIDYIMLHQRPNSTISFVGHSMGATALLSMLSTLPDYNKKLHIGILLAPLAFMGHARGPIKDLASVANMPSLVFQGLGDGEIFPTGKVPYSILRKYLSYCDGPRDHFCENPLFFTCGKISRCKGEVNTEFIARLMNHVPAGASTRTILHYSQLVRSGGFHKYGNTSAEFALKKITLPIVVFSSTDDQFATVPDIDRLFLSIANPIMHFVFRNECVSHTDFMWGENMSNFLYKNITKLIVW